MLWLDNLKILKKEKGLSCKQIAEKANMPERTVSRIFSGETPAPKIDNLCDIIIALDGSLDEVFEMFKGSKAVVGQADTVILQDELATTKNEVIALRSALAEANAKIDFLQRELQHKDEIIALHNYYNSKK